MNLKIKDVCFNYNSKPALNDITMSVDKGEIVSLVGPNGSGKSTLIKCINKILKYKIGTILVENQDIGRIKLGKLSRLLGYVPQETISSFPSTVFDMVLIGRRPYLNWGISSRDKEIVSHVLFSMELKDMALRYFNELSGGEKQKVLIARALVQEPQVLLLDEPTSDLDFKNQLETLTLITKVVKEKGISAVMAMHDLNLASRFSDRIAMLRDGRVHAAGKVEQVLNFENIKEVYGVDTIINNDSGRPHIIPLVSA
ncbi:MAG: ABC transporter ATP-binding protein [Candidatus Omnitrophica bacterium]|nr:ABC transporter ATP-binding protein [Candidatus Omnitrophota bacterium]